MPSPVIASWDRKRYNERMNTEVIERLRSSLQRVAELDSPALDVEWLRRRCDDTLRYAGLLQSDSARQLKRDVEKFVLEFPGILHERLVEDVRALVV